MKVLQHANKLILISIVTSALSFQGCSSGDADDEAVSATDDKVEEGALEDKAEATAEKAAPAPKDETPAQEVPAEVEPEGGAQQAQQPAAQQAPATEAPAVAAPAPADGTRIVRYVSAKSVALRDQPSSKGKKVGKVSRGDHLLVTIQGEWARTDDGKFIETKNLSEKPIGKKKRGAVWK